MLIAALSILGLINSLFLSYLHLSSSAKCIVNTGCDAVLASPYASIGPIPVAVIGLGFFLSIALILYTKRHALTKELYTSIYAITAPALLIALIFTGIQTVFIDGFCPFCLANAIIIAGIFFLSAKKGPGFSIFNPISEYKKAMPDLIIGIAIPILLVLAQPLLAAEENAASIAGREVSVNEIDAALGLQLMKLEQKIYKMRKDRVDILVLEAEAKRTGQRIDDLLQDQAKEIIIADAELEQFYQENKHRIPETMDREQAKSDMKRFLQNQAMQEKLPQYLKTLYQRHEVSITLPAPKTVIVPQNSYGTPKLGAENAAIKIIKFSDFECPHCRRAQNEIKEMMKDKRLKGKVSVEYRYFPLPHHKYATTAAVAAHCASKQGEFWSYSDELYKQQKTLGKQGVFTEIANAISLNTAQFNACLSDPKSIAAIVEDQEIGASIGISSTPTIIINGRVADGIPKKSDLLDLL